MTGLDHHELPELGTTGDKNKMTHKYTTDPTNAVPTILQSLIDVSIFSEQLILDQGFLVIAGSNNNMELFLMPVKQISTLTHTDRLLFNFERMFVQRKLVFP